MSDKPVDAWLERSRLDGMILAGFTYGSSSGFDTMLSLDPYNSSGLPLGIFFLLSVQASVAVYRGSRSTRRKTNQKISRLLLAYVGITFILATIGIAANARYTEDIWINFRGQEGWSPENLIDNEFDFWYNRLAIDSQEVLVWIMNALLLYRCCKVWSNAWWVVTLMGTVYLAIVGLSISVMVFAGESAVFANLNLQTSFLALSCTYNLLFTILVSIRLLTVRRTVQQALSPEHARPYMSITTTLVESASLYFIFDLIFLVSFAVHSDVENLILLENCLIQGIAQLLIINRVAEGREYNDEKRTKQMAESTITGTSGRFSNRPSQSTRLGSNRVELELTPVSEDEMSTRDNGTDMGRNSKVVMVV
ncbi:hypothetical protein D9757_010922 [Collybiopsis confluens]|uniref:Uncharacterized protein n=1 Tax=Collybiopsis confluens TaxID=2823264 RepID=A0A8H5GIR5_9AGAR|nr:hypothetical protein D9757_010922 [Collybiopsis confluens]